MNYGIRPLTHFERIDHRLCSFSRTYGGTVPITYPLNTNWSLTMPDQDAPDTLWGNPALRNGCTGFTTSELAQDSDRQVYNPRFTYDKTLLMEGETEGGQCTILDSLNSSVVYGLQGMGEDETEAATHRRSPPLIIHPTTGDMFDAIIDALAQGYSVSVGTPWLAAWNYVERNGIVSVAPMTTRASDYTDWHNWKICQAKMIDGAVYVGAKVWKGQNVADNGWYWFPRSIINALFAIPGTIAATNEKAGPQDYLRIKLTMLQVVLSYLYRRIGL